MILDNFSILLLGLAGLVLAVLILVLFFKKTDWGLYLLAFSLPFEGFALQTDIIALSATNILLLILVFAVVFQVLGGQRRLYFTPQVKALFVLIALLLGMDLLSFLVSPLPEAGVRSLITRFGSFLVFGLTASVAISQRQVKKIALFLLAAGLIASFLTVLRSFELVPFGKEILEARQIGGFTVPFQRTLGVDLDFGSFGMLLMPLIALSFISFFKRVPLAWPRFWAFFAFLLLVLAVFISQSRSTWLALLAVLALSAVFLLIRRPRISFGVLVLIILLITPLFSVYFGSFFTEDSAGLLVQVGRSGAANIFGRLGALEQGFRQLSLHPFGLGHGVFQPDVSGGVVHNNFINQLVATGFQGFIPYLLFILAVIWFYYQLAIAEWPKGSRLLSAALLIGFLGMLVELQFFLGFADKIFWITAGLLNGLGLSYAHRAGTVRGLTPPGAGRGR